MPLYPHESRRKRLEEAVTIGLFWLTLIGMVVALALASPNDVPVEKLLLDFWPYLVASIAGLIGLITYVRGGRK